MHLQGRDLKVDLSGDDVKVLHSELGQLGLHVPADEQARATFGAGTRDIVLRFQAQHHLAGTGVVDDETAKAINATVDALTPARPAVPPVVTPPVSPPERPPVGPVAPPTSPDYHVQGTVSSPDSVGVGTLQVQIVDRNVGQDVVLVTATTDNRGHYDTGFAGSLLTSRGKQHPDLQARVLAGRSQLGASEVRYDASTDETIDVALPAGPAGLRSEYETLAADLSPHYAGALGDLKEAPGQQDVTYLANKAGWDARAVALASLADQFSQNRAGDAGTAAANGIAAPFYYALFRAGLPASSDTLYKVGADTVEGVWKQAIDQGVIPSSLTSQLPAAVQAFQGLSAAGMLDARAIGGSSSLKDLLHLSLGDDPTRQQQFAGFYAAANGDPPTFWASVRQAFGDDTTNRLQLDGQMAYLTLNNAAVMGKLRDIESANQLTAAADLAQRGYYRADKWRALIDGAVPDSIPGSTVDEKRTNYADLMAAQVRLSFPTAVVAEMVRGGELQLDRADDVHAFLAAQAGKFEIGVHSVEQYIARNNLAVEAPVKEQLKLLQRVYQITPSDDAMAGLLKNRLHSAYQITRYDADQFAAAFKDDLGGENAAMLTYKKAQQVHNSVLNIATSYVVARGAPSIGNNQQALILNTAPAAAVADTAATGVIAYPTLEGLFGSMDYCNCDECRSVLSPAAYLVDLLLFTDNPAPPAGTQNPQDVLLARRPDLQHLPLTCENTNTPLPYIDLVNETLEYFVANNMSLQNYEGHNTDENAAAAELLASPQFVVDSAYDTLKAALFPPPLPFDRDLETVRRHFDKLGTPLARVMELMRRDDAIERADDASYGWRDILMERLGFSRDEYRLLTDRSVTLPQLYGFSNATSEGLARAALANVQAFSRRLDLTYDQGIELLRTRFVNPGSDLIPRLEQLHLSFDTLKRLKDGALSDADFDALLPPGLDVSQYGGDVKVWLRDDANFGRIMGLITITNPQSPDDFSSFDQMEFRYASPDNNALRPFEFVRMARFVRLWRKLGLSIELTDTLISALYPAGSLPTGAGDAADLQRLDAGMLGLLPAIGTAFQVADLLGLQPGRELPSLLAFWAPIDTHGSGSLYRRLFLNGLRSSRDAAFADDGFGSYLSDATQKLLDHAETLRAAFGLTDAELSQIADQLAFDANTLLTLDNVSAVYRWGWLARHLRLSLVELRLLVAMTGLDPFADSIRFLRLLQALKDAGLKPVQALYLIWNQDVSGTSAPEESDIGDFARRLRADFAAIEAQFAVSDDPTGELARARMALVYGADATDFLFGLLNGTTTQEVAYSQAQPELDGALNDASKADDGRPRLTYDDFRKRLAYAGVLTATQRDTLKGVAGVSAELQTALDGLFDAGQQATSPFFLRYPALQPLFDAYMQSAEPPQTRRAALLAALLGELKQERKQQQTLTSISATARSDVAFAEALLNDPRTLQSAFDATQPAIADLLALERGGLSARFFWHDSATGNAALSSDLQPSLDYSGAATAAHLPANPGGGVISAVWNGFIEAPESGAFKLTIETDAAAVSLSIDGADVALDNNAGVWSNHDEIELAAGSLLAISLRADGLTSNLTLRWQTQVRGREVMPSRYLHAASLMDRLRLCYVRFLKTTALAAALKLSAVEAAFLAANAGLNVNGEAWLNQLPVSGTPDSATATGLRDVLEALLDFARIKAQLSPGDDRLAGVLADPASVLPDGSSALLSLAGWEQPSLDVLLTRFGKTLADLRDIASFARVYDAYAVVKTFGLPASVLVAATTNVPDAAVVSDLQAALRARYDADAWLDVLKPISDDLRALQRDALVAYVLNRLGQSNGTSHIDTPDKLFEYFLMDVQMEPCMETSRIRHALSSVQLFIERCLMNLEPQVSPASLNAKRWEWMKRYRVWEANRKVFLWPENWLEPELRDDQSPFFKETMSELLQSDITEDTASVALLNYLSKLEEVAKLEPCGIYYAENDATTSADDVSHVVARTSGAHRKYYYRRREYGYWTPWDQIKLDIEDNPVAPVVWQGRLFVFWLRIIKQAPLDPSALPSSGGQKGDTHLTDISLNDIKSNAKSSALSSAVVKVQAALCWSEYYNGKWQPTKTSDTDRPADLGTFRAGGPYAFDRSNLTLAFAEEAEPLGDARALRVSVGGEAYAQFLLYNTHSLPVTGNDLPPAPVPASPLAARYLYANSNSELAAYYYPPGINPESDWDKVLQRLVLKDPIAFDVVAPLHQLANPWDAPFFLHDRRHVFYVTTTESLVTVAEYSGYGGIIGTQPWKADIPKLMQKPTVPDFTKPDPVSRDPRPGVIDPTPLERFVSEDANIHVAFGDGAAVRFNGSSIGAAGGLSNLARH